MEIANNLLEIYDLKQTPCLATLTVQDIHTSQHIPVEHNNALRKAAEYFTNRLREIAEDEGWESRYIRVYGREIKDKQGIYRLHMHFIISHNITDEQTRQINEQIGKHGVKLHRNVIRNPCAAANYMVSNDAELNSAILPQHCRRVQKSRNWERTEFQKRKNIKQNTYELRRTKRKLRECRDRRKRTLKDTPAWRGVNMEIRLLREAIVRIRVRIANWYARINANPLTSQQLEARLALHITQSADSDDTSLYNNTRRLNSPEETST